MVSVSGWASVQVVCVCVSTECMHPLSADKYFIWTLPKAIKDTSPCAQQGATILC